MPERRLPFVGFERGYFLDIQSFFPKKQLTGHKILSGPCNLRCYYCHRRDFLDCKPPMISTSKILMELHKIELYNTIVLTGGEITLHHVAGINIMKQLRRQGIITLFSTNGSFPSKVKQMLPLSNVVKIDIKGSKSQYKHITGHEVYDSVMKSIKIACNETNVEVKIILHDFTQPQHINLVLEDIYQNTGMPSNLAVEFQPVRDFLRLGIAEPDVRRMMAVCAIARPLPTITLLKHYGKKERIYRLKDGAWEVFCEKEIPLKFSWGNRNASQASM